MHPTTKLTTDWSKISINFLYVTVSIAEGIIETDLYVKPTDSLPAILLIVKTVYHIARH